MLAIFWSIFCRDGTASHEIAEPPVHIRVVKQMDKALNRSIRLVAVGGTAMALLRVKASTVDGDFSFSF
jgi:hypothetical protein